MSNKEKTAITIGIYNLASMNVTLSQVAVFLAKEHLTVAEAFRLGVMVQHCLETTATMSKDLKKLLPNQVLRTVQGALESTGLEPPSPDDAVRSKTPTPEETQFYVPTLIQHNVT